MMREASLGRVAALALAGAAVGASAAQTRGGWGRASGRSGDRSAIIGVDKQPALAKDRSDRERTMTAGRLGVWIATGLVVLLAAGLGVLRFRLLDVGSGAAIAAGDPAQGASGDARLRGKLGSTAAIGVK